jgi:hypothetical protein
MTEKKGDRYSDKDYWTAEAEAARLRASRGAGAAFDARPDIANIAREVSKQLGRDNAHKQRIVARSPHVFSSMDAEEVGQSSSIELAVRELKALGIDPGENDPVAILDAHHAGRQYVRGAGSRGSASDSAESGALDRFLDGLT